MRLLRRLLAPYFYLRDLQRIAIAVSKGSAMRQTRNVNLANPASWEFSGFSQNGEDGIIDVLRENLSDSNRYCIEIGCADGIENNSSWLILMQKFNGLLVEGDSILANRLRLNILSYSVGSECLNQYVSRDNIDGIVTTSRHKDPDVMSLDIDGIDYYVASALLDAGIRPKIFVVEYNSAFGPNERLTIEYQAGFDYSKAHPSKLYYGVSIMGWRAFFETVGYRFVTVDRNGVNAFFVDPKYFGEDFLNGIKGTEFAENVFQIRKHNAGYEAQFRMLDGMHFRML
jgi:hypothetical protein